MDSEKDSGTCRWHLPVERGLVAHLTADEGVLAQTARLDLADGEGLDLAPNGQRIR